MKRKEDSGEIIFSNQHEDQKRLAKSKRCGSLNYSGGLPNPTLILKDMALLHTWLEDCLRISGVYLENLHSSNSI